MGFNQREADIKYITKTLNEARASIIKASKQAKAMGLDTMTMEEARTKIEEAINNVAKGEEN